MLFDLGYDVWVAVPRGQDMSRFNSTLDPDSDDPMTGAAAFWNFGVDDMATQDIPAMINKILTQRQVNSECQKVRIVSHDKGGNYAMITMNELPTTSQANIQSLIAENPCFFQREDLYVEPVDEDDSKDSGHHHYNYYGKYYHYYHGNSWDRQAYYAEFDKIRAELTVKEYREFYYLYRAWEIANHGHWWKNELWKKGIMEALCAVQPENLRC